MYDNLVCSNLLDRINQLLAVSMSHVSLLELTLFHPLTRVQVAVLSRCLQHDNRPRPLGAPP